jgi:hypothetical protein
MVTSVIAWYVRHGHDLANQHPRRLSHKVIDYPLTELGVSQATMLARRLARQQASRACSLLGRLRVGGPGLAADPGPWRFLGADAGDRVGGTHGSKGRLST